MPPNRVHRNLVDGPPDARNMRLNQNKATGAQQWEEERSVTTTSEHGYGDFSLAYPVLPGVPQQREAVATSVGATGAGVVGTARAVMREQEEEEDDREEEREEMAAAYFRKIVAKFVFPHIKYITPRELHTAEFMTNAFLYYGTGYCEADKTKIGTAAKEWNRNLRHVAPAISSRRCAAIKSIRDAYISKYKYRYHATQTKNNPSKKSVLVLSQSGTKNARRKVRQCPPLKKWPWQEKKTMWNCLQRLLID